jgi:hypothetical protein
MGQRRVPQSPKLQVKSPQISRRRLWLFRLTAAVAAPVFLLALLEIALRLAGFGYATSFFLPRQINGRDCFVENERFGWRFFGPEMARSPFPLVLPRAKAPGTVRVFVFGESAAYGDPQPEFGLPRMLEALLSLRFPGRHFEVVNTGMTGINSNVILPIARDCATCPPFPKAVPSRIGLGRHADVRQEPRAPKRSAHDHRLRQFPEKS